RVQVGRNHRDRHPGGHSNGPGEVLGLVVLLPLLLFGPRSLVDLADIDDGHGVHVGWHPVEQVGEIVRAGAWQECPKGSRGEQMTGGHGGTSSGGILAWQFYRSADSSSRPAGIE